MRLVAHIYKDFLALYAIARLSNSIQKESNFKKCLYYAMTHPHQSSLKAILYHSVRHADLTLRKTPHHRSL